MSDKTHKKSCNATIPAGRYKIEAQKINMVVNFAIFFIFVCRKHDVILPLNSFVEFHFYLFNNNFFYV